MNRGNGLRKNDGKVRLNLIPASTTTLIGEVLTVGAEKYAERNWEQGMLWSKVMDSLERHYNAFKRGEDYDLETGLLHVAHMLTNVAFLGEYYHTFPEGDDRVQWYHRVPGIGLDIDEVLADFVGAWADRFGTPIPEFWNFDKDFMDRYHELCLNDKDFFLNIKPKISADSLPFEPVAYVTSRLCPTEWTEEWLVLNGFPSVPVISTGKSKVDAIKSVTGLDWFVDDRFENFVELNRDGVCCFLMDAPHNRRYNVGYKRIYSLNELISRFNLPV